LAHFGALSPALALKAMALALATAQSAPTPLPAQRAAAIRDPLAREVANLDPSLEGWDTEAFNSAAGAVLAKLALALRAPALLDERALEALAVPGVACGDLRPDELATVHSFGPVQVLRGTPGESARSGVEGFARALADLGAPYGASDDVHVKTKIVRVAERGERIDSGVLLHVWGDAGPTTVQQTCDWSIEWSWPDRDAPPRIVSVACTRYEETRSRGAMLADCTEAVLGAGGEWREQLLRGTDDWCRRISLAAGMNQYAHNGLAIGDADGDGLEDVYLCQGGGLPNRLFRRRADGTAEEISARAGVDFLDETMAALFVDLDDDGREELALTTARALLVLRAGEAGRFAVAAELPFPGGYSLAAADHDLDGRLDLYACRYTTANEPIGLPAPYHDANNGPPNALYRNLGRLRFEDVTVASGLDVNNRRFSFAASWADYDADGDPDLYVANDFGRNNLYRNDAAPDGKRIFRDVAAEAGVEDISAGMGASWGDYDGDGALDLYVSNMFSSAGLRVAYQRRFREGESAGTLDEFRRHARGNSLFRARGDGAFDDVTLASGASMGRWSWGAQFADLDHDGTLDLYVPNGFITNEDPEDL
jgi:hypothetical protein